jgi:hypothetical protein
MIGFTDHEQEQKITKAVNLITLDTASEQL